MLRDQHEATAGGHLQALDPMQLNESGLRGIAESPAHFLSCEMPGMHEHGGVGSGAAHPPDQLNDDQRILVLKLVMMSLL